MPSTIAKTITPQSSPENWLRNHPCPYPGEGVHEWIKSAAGAFKKIGLAIDEAQELIASNSTRSRPQPREIEGILAFVYGQASDTPRRPDRPKLPQFEPATLAGCQRRSGD
jgi:hypothetical protein